MSTHSPMLSKQCAIQRYYLTRSFEIVRIISTENNKNNITASLASSRSLLRKYFYSAFFVVVTTHERIHEKSQCSQSYNFHAKQPNRNIKPQHTQTERKRWCESECAKRRWESLRVQMKNIHLKSSNAATLAHRLHFSATLSAREHLVFVWARRTSSCQK